MKGLKVVGHTPSVRSSRTKMPCRFFSFNLLRHSFFLLNITGASFRSSVQKTAFYVCYWFMTLGTVYLLYFIVFIDNFKNLLLVIQLLNIELGENMYHSNDYI